MIMNLKSKTDFSGFYILFEGSTNIEKEGTRGASHLVEHLICKTFKDLRNDFQKNAIDWNASTTNNSVVFYFTGLEENLNPFRKKLVDRIFDFNITKNDFETERKIILEEYSDTFNTQNKKHLLNVYRKYLNSFAPIGNKEDLEKLRFIDIINFYQKFYDKPTKIINVSKKLKFESKLIDFNTEKIEKEYTIGQYDNKLEKITKNQEKSSVIFLLDLHTEDIDKLKIITKILGDGLESPLYKEVREKKALCYSIGTDTDRFNEQALFKIQLSTQKGKEEEVKEVITKILKNPDKFITKDRVDTIKKNLIIQQKKNDIDRYQNIQDYLNPDKFSIYRNIEKINIKNILDTYKDKFKLDKVKIDIDSI